MTDQTPQSQIHVDEDWKSRVKAEDAAMDAQRRGEGETPQPAGTSTAGQPSEEQFPPADFNGLVMMLSTQAMVGLGALPVPGQDRPTQNLAMAKYFIDLLSVLEEKTKNKLERQENNLLIQTLHELRIAYVEIKKAAS